MNDTLDTNYISMVIADALATVWRQGICNHYVDLYDGRYHAGVSNFKYTLKIWNLEMPRYFTGPRRSSWMMLSGQREHIRNKQNRKNFAIEYV